MSQGRSPRVHIALPPSVHERLKEAQAETGADTLTDVVRDAVATYIALVREHKQSGEVIVRSADGKEKAYALFMR